MSQNTDVVLEFIKAWNSRDLERILDFLAPDCVYHNIPTDPVTGAEAIRGVLQGLVGMAAEIEWIVHAVAETPDGKVLTERSDRFRLGDKWIDLPVMGTFEVAGGKISAWRDYFDMAQFTSQMS
jgi:limonene-1,2-epoxide hydrolase